MAGSIITKDVTDNALAMASSLNFSSCTHPALRDYETGYVKEGVGAGGLAIAAGLAGLSNPRLAHLCDQAMDQLQGREESGPSPVDGPLRQRRQ